MASKDWKQGAAVLRQLHELAGEPSYDEIVASCNRRGDLLGKGTISALLAGDREVRSRSVRRFVQACLDLDEKRHPPQLRDEQRTIEHWLQAYNDAIKGPQLGHTIETEPGGMVRADTGPEMARSRDPLSSLVVASDDIGRLVSLRYESETAPLIDFHARLFVGRERQIAQIRKHVLSSEPGYVFVESRLGFGKSALVAHVIKLIETGLWGDSVPDLAHFFIRRERQENTSIAFLTAVNAQLMNILNEARIVPSELESLRLQFADLWRSCAAQARPERPLLLIVDGLDEAEDERISIVDLLPALLGKHVGVLVTSRPNPDVRNEVSLDHPIRHAQVLTLEPLDETDLTALLRVCGLDEAAVAKAAPRVHRITRGEPVFVRAVCEDIATAAQVPAELDQLEQHPPDGVGAYFKRQLSHLRKVAHERLSWQILTMLTVAHGPMTLAEIADAAASPIPEVDRAVQPIARFLRPAEEERLEISEIQLKEAIVSFVGLAAIAASRKNLLSWCRRYESDRWPDYTPSYVALRYMAHLDPDKDYEVMTRLVGLPWMLLRGRRTGSHRVFADDVLRVTRAALDQQPADIFQAIRCGFAFTTLRAAAGHIPPSGLEALTRCGQVDQALDLAALLDEPEQRTVAYCGIARALASVTRRDVRASEALTQARKAAQRVVDTRRRRRAMSIVAMAGWIVGEQDEARTLASNLARVGDGARVIPQYDFPPIIEALAITGQQARAAELANHVVDHPHDPKADRNLDDVFNSMSALIDQDVNGGIDLFTKQSASTQSNTILYRRLSWLGAAAFSLALAGDRSAAEDLLNSALRDIGDLVMDGEIVAGIAVVHGKDGILHRLAEAHAHLGKFESAVAVIDTMPTPWRRGQALIRLAEISLATGRDGDTVASVTQRALTLIKSEDEPDATRTPSTKDLQALVGRAAAVLAATHRTDEAKGLVASLIRAAYNRIDSSALDDFRSEVVKILSSWPSVETRGRISEILSRIQSDNKRYEALASCAVASLDSGDYTQGALLTHSLVDEIEARGSLDALRPHYSDAPTWPATLVHASSLLGDGGGMDMGTRIFFHLAKQIKDPPFARQLPLQLLEIAASYARSGGADTARQMADASVSSFAPTDSLAPWSRLWANSARVHFLLGDIEAARQRADLVLPAIRRDMIFSGAIMVEIAKTLVEIDMHELARQVLNELVRKSQDDDMMLVQAFGVNAEIFVDLFSKDWVHDHLSSVSENDDKLGRLAYRRLEIAQAWHQLGENAKARKMAFEVIETDSHGSRDTGELISCHMRAAHVLVQLHEVDAARGIFLDTVRDLLSGRGRGERDFLYVYLLREAVPVLAALPGGLGQVLRMLFEFDDMNAWLRQGVQPDTTSLQ